MNVRENRNPYTQGAKEKLVSLPTSFLEILSVQQDVGVVVFLKVRK